MIKENADLIYASLIPLDEKRSSIDVFGNTIILDPTLTLNENAQHFYAYYQKMKRAIIHQKFQIEQTADQIQHFDLLKTYLAISTFEQLVDLEEELKPYGYKTQTKTNKKKHQKPILSQISDEQATYFIGKNSAQNDELIHKTARRSDYWFHVKDAPGAHVIVQTAHLNELVLRKAAKFAALFSRMKYSSSIPVDYTFVKHLKKIPGKPGFNVTYTTYSTIYIDLDEDFIKQYKDI